MYVDTTNVLITSNTLWRLRGSGHTEYRKVIPEEIAFNTITGVHLLSDPVTE